jgi:hypothetical protein
MLEQEAQMFGFRDKAFPASDMGSPQQMQIRGFITLNVAAPNCANGARKWPQAARSGKHRTGLPDASAL